MYGDLPIFITRYAADILDDACQANPQLCVMQSGNVVLLASYDGIQLLGRALSAFFDLLTLVFMFFIGRRLYGVKVGLLAAALGAATVLQIQQAHFYTADSVATFFVVAAMFFIIRLGDTFSWLDTIAAGSPAVWRCPAASTSRPSSAFWPWRCLCRFSAAGAIRSAKPRSKAPSGGWWSRASSP